MKFSVIDLIKFFKFKYLLIFLYFATLMYFFIFMSISCFGSDNGFSLKLVEFFIITLIISPLRDIYYLLNIKKLKEV